MSFSGAANFILSGKSSIIRYVLVPNIGSLPVPSLWLDVFQKIKAMGYNGVSFYSAWVIHEGKPGDFRAEGIFDWVPFFEAATKTGIYLIAVRQAHPL